jgi:hypothetical protein
VPPANTCCNSSDESFVKREVFEALKDKQPFHRKWNDDGTIKLGSDLAFCEKVIEAGFEVWTHLGYPCSHHKELDLLQLLDVMRQFNVNIKEFQNEKAI